MLFQGTRVGPGRGLVGYAWEELREMDLRSDSKHQTRILRKPSGHSLSVVMVGHWELQ